LGGHAHGDEFRQVLAVIREDAECPIAGADEPSCLLHDGGQEVIEIGINLDGQDGIDDRMKPLGLTDPMVRHHCSLVRWSARSLAGPAGPLSGHNIKREPQEGTGFAQCR